MSAEETRSLAAAAVRPGNGPSSCRWRDPSYLITTASESLPKRAWKVRGIRIIGKVTDYYNEKECATKCQAQKQLVAVATRSPASAVARDESRRSGARRFSSVRPTRDEASDCTSSFEKTPDAGLLRLRPDHEACRRKGRRSAGLGPIFGYSIAPPPFPTSGTNRKMCFSTRS
jgi:hypothetical protein